MRGLAENRMVSLLFDRHCPGEVRSFSERLGDDRF